MAPAAAPRPAGLRSSVPRGERARARALGSASAPFKAADGARGPPGNGAGRKTARTALGGPARRRGKTPRLAFFEAAAVSGSCEGRLSHHANQPDPPGAFGKPPDRFEKTMTRPRASAFLRRSRALLLELRHARLERLQLRLLPLPVFESMKWVLVRRAPPRIFFCPSVRGVSRSFFASGGEVGCWRWPPGNRGVFLKSKKMTRRAAPRRVRRACSRFRSRDRRSRSSELMCSARRFVPDMESAIWFVRTRTCAPSLSSVRGAFWTAPFGWQTHREWARCRSEFRLQRANVRRARRAPALDRNLHVPGSPRKTNPSDSEDTRAMVRDARLGKEIASLAPPQPPVPLPRPPSPAPARPAGASDPAEFPNSKTHVTFFEREEF